MKIENIEVENYFTMKNAYSNKAKEYILRILYGVEQFERHRQRPTIIMSMDIFEILVSFTHDTIKYNSADEITCCGRDVKLAYGKGVLLVACDLSQI